MISKQASILPRRLIRRYHTNDPFEIAAALDITVMERSDFQRQKGAFKVVLHNSFIFINAKIEAWIKVLKEQMLFLPLDPCDGRTRTVQPALPGYLI